MMTYKPSARLCDGTEGQQRLEEKDVDARDLQRELRSLSRLVNDDDGPLDVLRYIVSSGLVDVYCNVFVALRIVLSIPVTVALAERSFSEPQIITNYLRSTMIQQRLSGLAELCIENDTCKNIPKDDIIDQFAAAKARKAPFC